MAKRTRWLGLGVLVLTAAACTDDDATTPEQTTTAEADTGSTTDLDDETTADAPAVARYHEDVRPILARHCVGCHSPGQIAPFSLETYDDAAPWGEAVVAATTARTMPPFALNNDGSCNTFQDASWLSEDELATLTAWAEAGYPEGDASLAAPQVPPTPELAGDVTTLALPEYFPQPSEAVDSLDDYRCFLAPLDLEQDRYLTGFDVQAGDPTLVHHVLGFRIDPALFGNAARMAELDDQSPDVPGWECFGAAGEDVFPSGVPVIWAPGTGATHFPDGAGIRLKPGDVMVVQVHYNLANGAATDDTRVRLEFTDQVEREAVQILWDPFLFDSQFGGGTELPPGQASTRYDWEDTFEQMLSFDNPDGVAYEEIELLGVFPHMHKRGRTMSIDLVRSDDTSCAADVDRYDYNWQRLYFFEEPIVASLDDRLSVSCEWSTEADDEPIAAGFGTDDEMCLTGVMFSPR